MKAFFKRQFYYWVVAIPLIFGEVHLDRHLGFDLDFAAGWILATYYLWLERKLNTTPRPAE